MLQNQDNSIGKNIKREPSSPRWDLIDRSNVVELQIKGNGINFTTIKKNALKQKLTQALVTRNILHFNSG